MKIAIFEIMPGDREALSAQLTAGHETEYHEDRLTMETAHLAADADIVSVFVKSEITAPLIDKLPNLKCISTRSMGFDHIDVAYAKTKGIRSVNVTSYASHPVAEFTFALLLSVARRIYHAYGQLRDGMNFDIRGLKGFTLFGKTIGVAGTGNIGRNVVTIAKGFGMNILAFDVHEDTAFSSEAGFQYVPLNELAAKSDIVTLHLPYNKETHHLFDTAMFSRMKKGAMLINTARGEIVDTHALVAALSNGTLWGAGLDVLESEGQLHEENAEIAGNKEAVDYALITANHVLIDMPNVVVTPHIAFETVEAMSEINRATAEMINNFIAGADQKYL